jgi:hypothetical protein
MMVRSALLSALFCTAGLGLFLRAGPDLRGPASSPWPWRRSSTTRCGGGLRAGGGHEPRGGSCCAPPGARHAQARAGARRGAGRGRAVAPAELLERPELAALMDRATLYRTLDLLGRARAGAGAPWGRTGLPLLRRGRGAPWGVPTAISTACAATPCAACPRAPWPWNRALPARRRRGHVEIRVDGRWRRLPRAEAAAG